MKKSNKLIKLYLMVITLPKGKKEIIADMLEKYDVTAYLSTLARGSVERTVSKDVMFCIIKEDMIKDAMLEIEDKIARFYNQASMVYAIPLNSVIGVSTYMALSNGGKK